MRVDAKLFRLRWWREVLSARWEVFRARRDFTGPYVYDKTVEGEPFKFFIGDPTAEAWYGRRSDIYDIEMRFVRDHMLRVGDVVIEIGAHHGHDTVLLSKWVGPSGKVIAFEPLAGNAAAIERNLALNDLDHVEVVQAALGAVDASVSMASESNSRVVLDAKDGPRSGRAGEDGDVPLVSLDSFCAARNLIPDLIKIDVEGYEFEVLRGAKDVLRRHHPALQIEVHGDQLHRYGTRSAELWDLIDADGYDVWLQQNDLVAPERCTKGADLAGRVHVFFTPKESAQVPPSVPA